MALDSKVQTKKIFSQKGNQRIIIDKTAIKAGSELVWLWAIIEPKHKEILACNISKERNMFVAERIQRACQTMMVSCFLCHYNLNIYPYRIWIYLYRFYMEKVFEYSRIWKKIGID